MKRTGSMRLGASAAAAAIVLAVGTGEAQTYHFDIATSQDTANGEFTLGNPLAPHQVTSVTGFVDGSPITGLSTYGGADEYLSPTSPYVDRAGLAFSSSTLSFNIFENYADANGNPVYSFCNSAFNGGCTGGDANAAPVAAFTLSAGAVPEPATWAMMILGFGMVGFGLRYRRRSQAARVDFA